MQTELILLDGSPATVDVPDAAALGTPVAIGVLRTDGVEIEVNAGPEAAAKVFLDVTGTKLTGEVRLRGGDTVRLGALHGDKANGWAFVVTAGDARLFGSAAPSITSERLVAALSDAGLRRTARGLTLSPAGSVEWSPFRTQGASVLAKLGRGGNVLVDVRRAVAGQKPSGRGVAVRGGRLTRSTGQGRLHVVLENADFVTYGIPTPDTDLDALADAMAKVQVSLS